MKCDKYLTVVPLTRRDSRPLSELAQHDRSNSNVDANSFMGCGRNKPSSITGGRSAIAADQHALQKS